MDTSFKVGLDLCDYCKEYIADGDARVRDTICKIQLIPQVEDDLPPFVVSTLEKVVLHSNCRIRTLIGGVNHLKGECFCCSGTDGIPPDPPGLTKKQAADAAVDYWETVREVPKHLQNRNSC